MKTKKSKNKPQVHSRRWRDSERRIWTGFYTVMRRKKLRFQIQEICQLAGVKPPTFYRHFIDLETALIETEDNILREFITNTVEIRQNRTCDLYNFANQNEQNIKIVIQRWFITIAKNHDYFSMALDRGNIQLLRTSIEEIKSEITYNWASYGQNFDQERFEIFCCSVIGVIIDWRRSNFNIEELDQRVKRAIEIWRRS